MEKIDLNTAPLSTFDAFEIERMARIERARYFNTLLRAAGAALIARLRPSTVRQTA